MTPDRGIPILRGVALTTDSSLAGIAVSRFGNMLLGINGGLAEEGDLAELGPRFPDDRCWSGEGDYVHMREA